MVLKYKCTVEAELPFPDDMDEKVINQAKTAIDQIIDQSIYNAVFEEMCDDTCTLKVTRESLEYVDNTTTTSCVLEDEQTQDVVSEEA